MADDKGSPVETSIRREPARSIELGMPLGSDQKPTVKTAPTSGTTADFDNGTVTIHDNGEDAVTKQRKEAQPNDGTEAGTGGQDDNTDKGQEGGAGEAEALPAFNPDSPDVLSKYESAYINQETGEPNLDALSAEWFKGASKDTNGNWQGGLKDDDYAFLETKGYSKDMVKSVEAGQIALLQQQEQTFYARAGGADRLQKALEWAKGGGYTPEQKTRYNATVVEGRDNNAKGDQIDLLMTRWAAATGNGRRLGPRTKVNPGRSVAASAGASGTGAAGAKPYADYKEWQTDVRIAQKDGNQKLLNDSRARLAASPWYTGGK